MMRLYKFYITDTRILEFIKESKDFLQGLSPKF